MTATQNKLIKILCVLFALTIFSSCTYFGKVWDRYKERKLILNQQFSINLANPQKNWPRKNRISVIEKQALEEYGKPDYVRIWWDKKGKLLTQKELGDMMKKADGNYDSYKKSWVYLDPEREIVFLGDGKMREQPLSDKLRVITEFGDPEDIKLNVKSDSEASYDRWMYYSKGKMFDFHGEKKVKEDSFDAMGGPFMKK